MTKWLVNNANNLLLSAAGLVILTTALVLRTQEVNFLTAHPHRHRLTPGEGG